MTLRMRHIMLFIVLMLVETTDVVFALDAIAGALRNQPFRFLQHQVAHGTPARAFGQ